MLDNGLVLSCYKEESTLRYVRFQTDQVQYGLIEGNIIRVLDSDFLTGGKITEREIPLTGVKLLTPCNPGKVVCIGLNYLDHALEMGLPVPEEPIIFFKPPSALLAPGAPVAYPKMSRQVDFEAELAVVIGKQAHSLDEKKASECIFGFTCANDVTARDLQKKDGQWTRAKGFDTFLPLGPWIETDLNPDNLEITLYLNGSVKQRSNTRNFIFPVNRLVSFVSQVMTLEPGDVILTGTPNGVGPMLPGDKVVVAVEGIGELSNTVG